MSAGEITLTSINLSWSFVVLECNFLNSRIIKKGNVVRLGPVKIKNRLQQLNAPLSSPSSPV